MVGQEAVIRRAFPALLPSAGEAGKLISPCAGLRAPGPAERRPRLRPSCRYCRTAELRRAAGPPVPPVPLPLEGSFAVRAASSPRPAAGQDRAVRPPRWPAGEKPDHSCSAPRPCPRNRPGRNPFQWPAYRAARLPDRTDEALKKGPLVVGYQVACQARLPRIDRLESWVGKRGIPFVNTP